MGHTGLKNLQLTYSTYLKENHWGKHGEPSNQVYEEATQSEEALHEISACLLCACCVLAVCLLCSCCVLGVYLVVYNLCLMHLMHF